MPHVRGHGGSSRDIPTTYGMPRREALNRGRQQLGLINKQKDALDRISDNFMNDPSIRNLVSLRKQGKKVKSLIKSGNKIADVLFATHPNKNKKGFN
tara:strand:+ start:26 stop:316 length:291 start_codon:yes stop_codon:yes gene_type:complete